MSKAKRTRSDLDSLGHFESCSSGFFAMVFALTMIVGNDRAPPNEVCREICMFRVQDGNGKFRQPLLVKQSKIKLDADKTNFSPRFSMVSVFNFLPCCLTPQNPKLVAILPSFGSKQNPLAQSKSLPAGCTRPPSIVILSRRLFSDRRLLSLSYYQSFRQ